MKVDVFTPETSAAGSAPWTSVSVPPARGWASAGAAASAMSATASAVRRSVRSMVDPPVDLLERDRGCVVDGTAALHDGRARIVADAVRELARLVDVPDREVGELAGLERAARVEHA